MARVTVEDCLEKQNNRFALVIMAAERARQLSKGAAALVHCKNKAAVTALREIADGKVRFIQDVRSTIREYLLEIAQQDLKSSDPRMESHRDSGGPLKE